MIMRLLVLYLITLFASCIESKKSNQEEENNSLNITDTASYIKIAPNTKIEVLTVKKIVDTLLENYEDERDYLIDWKLSKTQIDTILHKSEQLDFLSCFEEPPIVYYLCKVLINNKLVNCQVLKDGKTNIMYSDTTVTLGYMNADFSNYFSKKFWETLPKEISSKKEQDKSTEPKPTAPYTIITPKTKIEVLTAKKTVNTLSLHYEAVKDELKNWKLNKEQIKTILSKSREINGREWHYLYSHLPAHYSGKVLIDSKTATYKVHAGAVSYLFFTDTTIRLGFPHTDYQKYFLDGEWKEPYEDTKAE